MPDIEASQEPEPRDEGHYRWLAMKSAYAAYRCASEELASIHQSADDLFTSESARLWTLDARQRLAFERYLEARMEFLEFRCDERNGPGGDLVDAPAENRGFWGIDSRFVSSGWIPPVLAMMLLCATTPFLIRQQQHVHDLQLVCDELRATLSETHRTIETLTKEVNDRGPNQHSDIQQINHTASPPARTPRPAEWKRPRKQIYSPRTQTIGTRGYNNFSLVPFHPFKRIGPIEMMVRSLNADRGCVSLSIVSSSGKQELPCLRMNQPVRINSGYRGQSLQLVVDRIDRYGVYGRLIESLGEKTDLRASRHKSGQQVTP